MKGKKEILVLVLVIAALSAFLVLQKTDRRHYSLPEVVPADAQKITRVEVRRGDGTGVSLVREAGRWVIQPGGFPADAAQVDDLLGLLAGLTLTAVASEAGNEAVYELDPGRRIEVEAFAGDDPVRRLEVGKAAPTGQHTFVKVAGDDRIFHARENLRGRLDKDADRLRDKQVLKIDEDVTEVVLARGDRRLRLVKGPAGAPPEAPAGGAGEGEAPPSPPPDAWRTEAGKPVKTAEVDGLLRTLSDLKCSDYPPESARENLGPPAFTVTLKGAGTYELSLYGEGEGGKVLATSSQSGYVFSLPAWQAKRVDLDLESLEEPAGGAS